MFKKLKEKYKNLPPQLRASIWFLICAFLQKGIVSITTPIFTRLLSTAEYGQFNVFTSWLSIVNIFVSLNLFCGVYTQGLVKFDKERKQYTSSLQGLTFTLFLFWTIVYLVFQNFWNQLLGLTTVQSLAMLIMIWTSAVFGFWSVEQRVDYKYRALIIATLVVSLAKPIIGVIFVIFAADKVTARILSMVLVEIIAFSGFFFWQMYKGKQFYNQKFWKYALRFNIPLIPHYLSMSILSSSDRIMISSMVGESAAGIYSLAYSVSLIMTMFNSALTQALEPWLYQKIKSKKINDVSGVAYVSFLLIAGLNLTLIAFAPEIISIFAPKEYHDAIWIIPPVAMSVFFMFLYTFFAVFEFYYEKTKFITLATAVGAIVNIALNYIFINIFGYYAAGYTTLLCYVIFSIFHYLFMKKISRNSLDNIQVYNTKKILVISVGFVTMGFVFLFTYSITILRYGLIFSFLILLILKHKAIIKGVKHILKAKQQNDI